MRKLMLVGAAFVLCSVIQAQEEIGAPYNPDVNADSLINLPDMLGILPLFGQPFLPSEDDLDSTNEIQSLYLSGDTLYLIPNGGYVLLEDLGISGADGTNNAGDGDISIIDSAEDLFPETCYQYVWTDLPANDSSPFGIKRTVGFHDNAVYCLNYSGHLIKVEGANLVETVTEDPFAGLMDLGDVYEWGSNRFWADIIDGKFMGATREGDVVVYDLELNTHTVVIENWIPNTSSQFYNQGADISALDDGPDRVYYGDGWWVLRGYISPYNWYVVNTISGDYYIHDTSSIGQFHINAGKMYELYSAGGIFNLEIMDLQSGDLETVELPNVDNLGLNYSSTELIVREGLIYLAQMTEEFAPRALYVTTIDPSNFYSVIETVQVLFYPDIGNTPGNLAYKLHEGDNRWRISNRLNYGEFPLSAIMIGDTIYSVGGAQVQWIFDPASHNLESICSPKSYELMFHSRNGDYLANTITGDDYTANEQFNALPPTIMQFLGAQIAWSIPINQ